MGTIRHVLIMGGGLMGKNIAFVASSVKDLDVTVYDINAVDIASGIRQNTAQLVEKGVISAQELEERLQRISFTTDIDDPRIAAADIVIEAVFEDMNIKRETFAKLEERCREDCIFCTNSSVMSPSEISRDLKKRDRFVGTHFWNPGHLIPLVEVVRTDATDDATAQTVMDFMAAIGKKPCLCKKDVPGFIANRLQHALWREAFSIIDNGIADAATVDTAIKNSFGLRLPQLSVCENSDLVGTDLTYNIHDYVLQYIEDAHRPARCIVEMKEAGKLGFKSGEGFYQWTEEAKKKCADDLNEYLIRMLYNK